MCTLTLSLPMCLYPSIINNFILAIVLGKKCILSSNYLSSTFKLYIFLGSWLWTLVQTTWVEEERYCEHFKTFIQDPEPILKKMPNISGKRPHFTPTTL